MSLFNTDDAKALKADKLMRAMARLRADIDLSDAQVLRYLKVAERDIGRRLKVLLEPTEIFSYEPSPAQITALDGTPYLVEPGYDYDPSFFQAGTWGYIQTRQRPIINVSEVRFAYPNPLQAFYTLPIEWVRTDKKYGQIQMVPASAAASMPLNVFIMSVVGGGMMVPFMLQVRYRAGLENAKEEWPDLIDVIEKQAVLSMIEGEFFPNSESISADGLSQSMSVDMEKYRDAISYKLFGPKGANGGLWTAIHGVGLTVAGVVS